LIAAIGRQVTGSGLVILNPPWGLADDLARLTALYAGV
jgi:23S rRNA A2030 N6-methylase RlmJ